FLHATFQLSPTKVIHGDLATRNVLITHDLKAKVSDFGLSKQINFQEVYIQKTNVPLPVRWMAYESLKNLEFTTLSDIWSLGVTLWEMFTLGGIPYESYVWEYQSSSLLADGIRLEKPAFASHEIYELMSKTWKIEPSKRPSYSVLRESLNRILNNLNKQTVIQNETHLRLPRVIEELTFECNSSIPTRWNYLSQQISSFSVKKVEINKWHFHKLEGNRPEDLFQSTFTVALQNPESMMQLSCEIVLPDEEPDDYKLNTYLEITNEDTHSTFLDLQFAHGNRKTRRQRYKLYTKWDSRLGHNRDCKYSLHVDLERGMYACVLANNSQEEVRTSFLPCDNLNECETFFKYNGDAHCNTNDTFQYTCTSHVCSEIRTKATLFVIGCGEYGNNSVARGFYRTLDDVQNGRKRIFEYNRKDVPFKQMGEIRSAMSEHPEMEYAQNKQVIFTKYEREFVCTALKSFSSYGFLWLLRYKNGILVDIGAGNESSNDTTQLYISRMTVLFNDTSIEKIICEAPNWKTVNGTNFELDLRVQESISPCTHKNVCDDTKNSITKQTISIDVRNETEILRCNRTGKPPAVITWKFDGHKHEENNGSETTSNYYNKTEYPDKSEIELVSNHPYREIVCTAKNNAGKAKVYFQFKRGSITQTTLDMKSLLGIISGASVVLILVVGVAWYKIRTNIKGTYMSNDDIEEFFTGASEGHDALLLPYNIRLEVPRDSFYLDKVTLGSGTFGKVVKGHIGFLAVAIKITKSGSQSLMYVKSLLKEIKIMSYVGNHPNIVNLFGACTSKLDKNEVFVILEFCERGDLRSILTKGRENFIDLFETSSVGTMPNGSVVSELASSNMILSTSHLIQWAINIVDGMDFISSKNVIHGDLATRNVLITHDLKAKVSDFGLSKQINFQEVYIQKSHVPLPVRWMAYESLKNLEFTTLSDIWSLGVTLWEMFSLGGIPYENYVWEYQSSSLLAEGVRLEKPAFSSLEIYELMCETWKIEPTDRPSYSVLRESLNRILSNLYQQ
ncbi:unnamed protein product, partial [Allacma fusca]